MKIKGSSYFYIAIMVVMLVIIGSSLSMKYFESRLLPLVVGSAVFALSAIGLWREIAAENRREATVTRGETVKKKEAGESWRGYLVAGAWLMGFFLTIYLLGYIIAIPLFILAYMKSHGSKWLVATVFAIITSVIIYGVFRLALNIELYRGLIFGG